MSDQFEIFICYTSHLKHFYIVSYLNSYSWVNKANNIFSSVVDDVEYRLDRIAHSNTKKELHEIIHDLRNSELYHEKPKTWVERMSSKADPITLLRLKWSSLRK